MSRAQLPRLLHSPLTGRVYIATAYTELPDGQVISTAKVDVTDEFHAIAAAMPVTNLAADERGERGAVVDGAGEVSEWRS